MAALTAPARHRRAALIACGALGTLPDLDLIPLKHSPADAVSLVTWHRGPSHSLLVLAIFGWLLWLALRRWWAPGQGSSRSTLWAIELALLTDPLLDGLTIYGTQPFWPLPGSPVMGASIFIIIRLYRPAGCCLRRRLVAARAEGGQLVVAGECLASTAHLGWSLAAKTIVERAAEHTLAPKARRTRRASQCQCHQHASLARGDDDAGWISGR